METIIQSVSKTSKLLIVDESYAMCGIGAEISAAVTEQAFDALDAPIGRLHTEEVTHPFAPSLENEIMIGPEKVKRAARAVIAGTPLVAKRIQAEGCADEAASAVFESTSQPVHSNGQSSAEEEQYLEGSPFNMPFQDLTITEATVVRWLKQVGETVATGEAVVEMETDKALTEIESPIEGVLVETIANEGDVVQLGQRMGTIQTS